MARRPRVEVAGGLYHVIVRGNERRAIFHDDLDREDYLDRLDRYGRRFEFSLLAYCLMDNHVHLAVETGRTPLSRAMHAIQFSYTQAFNRRHGRVGHLFQGRYKAFLVEKDRYWLALLRYIHENPTKAGMVDRPERYQWSSDRFYRTGQGPVWLALDLGLSLLGPRRSAACQVYCQLMGDPHGEPYERVAGVAQVIKGEEEFASRILEAEDDRDLIRRSLRIEKVARVVARTDGLDLGHLRAPTRRRNVSRARAITGYLGKTYGNISYAATARFFNRDASTLAKDIRRLEIALRESPQLRKRLELLATGLLDGG